MAQTIPWGPTSANSRVTEGVFDPWGTAQASTQASTLAQPQQQASSGLKITAPPAPELTALSNRYMGEGGYLDRSDKFLNDFEGNTGHFMEQAGAKMRDADRGGRSALQSSNTLRGVGSSNSLANFDATTNRNVNRAIADTAVERERTYGGALNAHGDAIAKGVGVADAPYARSLAERQFGLQTYATEAGVAATAARDSQASWQAMLDAQRSSPIYTGYDSAPQQQQSAGRQAYSGDAGGGSIHL